MTIGDWGSDRGTVEEAEQILKEPVRIGPESRTGGLMRRGRESDRMRVGATEVREKGKRGWKERWETAFL